MFDCQTHSRSLFSDFVILEPCPLRAACCYHPARVPWPPLVSSHSTDDISALFPFLPFLPLPHIFQSLIMSSALRRNRWWIPSEGIARVVISADIQRYLGPDAVVKPGDGIDNNEGIPGYWITAPRTLTSEMIQDLKQDTQRWEMEQREAGRRGEQPNAPAYEASATYRSRHYYGPTETQHSPHQPAPQPQRESRPTYGEQPSPHYTAAPYASPSQPSPYAHTGYHNHNSVPRTNPSPYGSQYGQPPPNQRTDYAGYASHATHSSQPQYSNYGHAQPAPNAYTQTQQYAYPPHQTPRQSNQLPRTTVRTARPGYYIASDGNEYPVPAGGLPQ